MRSVDEDNLWIIFGNSYLAEDISYPFGRVDRYFGREPAAPLWKIVAEIGKQLEFDFHCPSVRRVFSSASTIEES
jgi:hypothetical protein